MSYLNHRTVITGPTMPRPVTSPGLQAIERLPITFQQDQLLETLDSSLVGHSVHLFPSLNRLTMDCGTVGMPLKQTIFLACAT